MEAVLLYIACLRLGAVFVPVNVASALNEVGYVLGDCSPRLVIVSEGERAALAPLTGGARLETLGADGGGTLGELAAHRPVVGAGVRSRGVDQMHQGPAALDMAEEPVA